MPIATGVFKKLSFKKQTALNTKAPAGAGGSAQYMRRVTSSLDLNKATYQSNENLPSQQVRDMRHGVRAVSGSINGELSVGGYQKPLESVLRQTAQVQTTTGALVNVTVASTGARSGTYTRAAGSFITDGFKNGDVIQSTGWTAPALPNNTHNLLVIGVTALVLTFITLDGTAVVAKASGDSVTTVTVGKKTWVPQSGQTRDYYTIEHWFSDIAQSEQFVDCVFTGANIALPPTGMATVEFPVMGLDMQTGVAEYFTTPAAAPAGPILAAVNGALVINGVLAGLVTGININIDGGYTVPGGVVGANVDPDVFPGTLTVSGQATILFQDATFRDLFINETESSLYVALTGSNLPGAPVTCFVMPRIKFAGANKDDGKAGLTLTVPYTALERTDGSTVDLPTTISIQDSAFV